MIEPTAEQRALGRRLRQLAQQIMGEADALDPRAPPATADDTDRLDWLDRHGASVRKRRAGPRNLLVWNRDGLRHAIDKRRRQQAGEDGEAGS